MKSIKVKITVPRVLSLVCTPFPVIVATTCGTDRRSYVYLAQDAINRVEFDLLRPVRRSWESLCQMEDLAVAGYRETAIDVERGTLEPEDDLGDSRAVRARSCGMAGNVWMDARLARGLVQALGTWRTQNPAPAGSGPQMRSAPGWDVLLLVRAMAAAAGLLEQLDAIPLTKEATREHG